MYAMFEFGDRGGGVVGLHNFFSSYFQSTPTIYFRRGDPRGKVFAQSRLLLKKKKTFFFFS